MKSLLACYTLHFLIHFTITWYATFLDVFVWYIFSINHVEKANEAIAVETLLVTDELFR